MLIAELLKTPPRLWTVADYAAIGETEPGYTELVAGRLLVSPSPGPCHQAVLGELASRLDPQIPPGLEVILDLDIDLELAACDQPGFSRRPDLVIVDHDAIERVGAEGGLLRASEVRIVVEIVTPDSRRIDTIDKRSEYTEAGIRWYWMIDITDPISLVVCRDGVDYQRTSGTFTAEEPFPISVELGLLR